MTTAAKRAVDDVVTQLIEEATAKLKDAQSRLSGNTANHYRLGNAIGHARLVVTELKTRDTRARVGA